MPTQPLYPGDPDCEYEAVISEQRTGGRGRGNYVSVARVYRKGRPEQLGENYYGEGRTKASADQRAVEEARQLFRPPQEEE